MRTTIILTFKQAYMLLSNLPANHQIKANAEVLNKVINSVKPNQK
jgi:hypothetical protein